MAGAQVIYLVEASCKLISIPGLKLSTAMASSAQYFLVHSPKSFEKAVASWPYESNVKPVTTKDIAKEIKVRYKVYLCKKR